MTIAVLRRAVELEVNFIDTADSSGPHVSETLLHRTESVSGRSGALRGTLSPDADRLIWARARQLNRSSRRAERGVGVHAGQGVTGD
jgi:hypothetical protein